MNSIDRLKAASARAEEIVIGLIGKASEAPDALEARREELESMDHSELVEMILGLEKVKGNSGVKIEQVAKALLEDEQLAIFTYDQLAKTITKHVPDAKTTGKGLASYVTKHRDEWAVVKRERFTLNPADIMAAVGE